jgi:phage regulator Rha-like protein
MNKTIITVPNESIISRIFLIRGKKVMFDRDLAELYEVETRILNQAVKRNISRFPDDFSFILNAEENRLWEGRHSRSQFVILKQGVNTKYYPRVFTEQGVAMLSSVLRSSKAVQTNIQIIRTFTKLREILSENKKLADKLEKMEEKYDFRISEIFNVLKNLVYEKKIPKEKIGFKP